MRPFARTVALVSAVSVAIVVASLWKTESGTAAVASTCTNGILNIVAHQDDDLLFQSPNLYNNIAGGQCVRTVYLTSGDSGSNATYWRGREAGVEAAYALMAGVANSWVTSDAGVSRYPIRVRTLAAKPSISLVFLRLPDGNIDGSGFSATGYESLQKLYTGAISSIHSLDSSASYSLAALGSTLLALIVGCQPTMINTLDYVGSYGDGDHSDHHTVGYLVQAALTLYSTPHTLTGYLGYGENSRGPNLSSQDATNKANAFYQYGYYDPKTCYSQATCSSKPEGGWLLRQYIVATSTTVPAKQASGADLALTATASSQNTSTAPMAMQSIDGVVDGYRGDYTREWATVGGGAGSSLTLTWPSAVTVSSVVLLDRPNLNDQITGGTLTFSDGTTVPVPPLNTDGSATTVTFTARATTSLELTVTSVSGATGNVGLAEIQAFGPDPSSAPPSSAPSSSTPPPPTAPTPTAPTPTPTPTNVALTATASASSQNTSTGQTAAKAIDGVIDGYPGDHTREWATVYGVAGSYLSLVWSSPVTISRVVLYDRPNTNDQVTGGTLTFSDGTSVPVPSLNNNNGTATTVSFTARSTTILKFTITSVSRTTQNVGLAEIQAFTR